MKIVLDTNCLVNVIMPGSFNNMVWQAFRENKFVLCVSNEILFEYHEILSKRYNHLIANTILKELIETPNLERVYPTFRFNLKTSDPDDNKFVDCAICGSAELIVTNDAHFNILRTIDFPTVEVKTIQQFVAEMGT